MIGKLLSFFEGEAELYADEIYRDRLVSVVAESGVRAKITNNAENSGVSVRLSPQNAKKIASALDKFNIIVYINSVCGLKTELISRCKRIGLLIGAVLFFALLSLSTLFVFKVEVSGSELIAVQDVKAELSDFGIRVGARLSDIDRTAVANRFLQLHPELSWAAISFKGTTVRLELKEKTEAPPFSDDKADFLIAGCDGVVKNILVYSGKAVVAPNTVVKKGDLLISGYVSGSGLQYTDNPILRYEGASGSVTAEVVESISSYVLFVEETVRTENGKHSGTVFEIFGKRITVGKVENSDGYHMMPEKNLTIWGRIELPITYRECYEIKRTAEVVRRDEAQATLCARARAYEELSGALDGASLSEIEILSDADETGARVVLNYVCLREIAVPKMKEN